MDESNIKTNTLFETLNLNQITPAKSKNWKSHLIFINVKLDGRALKMLT
jgi:hypothetical protein